MTRGRFLFSQILLFALVGTVAALLVWAAMIWPAYRIWHPPGAISLDAWAIWKLKIRTILALYLPFGLVLGAGVAMIQPVWDSSLFRAIRNEWRWLLLGALLGGVGAVVGGLAGEYVLNELRTETAGRILGAPIMGIVLGTTLGLSERWRTGSQERLVAGIVGGALGGMLSGLVFQYARFGTATRSVVSVMAFAALVVGAIGAVAFLRTRARLVGLPGNPLKYAKWERDLLSDAKNIIGSAVPGSPKAIIKLYDQTILPEHAIIYCEAGDWRICRYNANVRDLFVNDERITDEARYLRSGDVIQIGKNLKFRFEVER